MATGEYQGMDVHHPRIRAMFTRAQLLKSDWYRERLQLKQLRDIELWKRHCTSLQQFLDDVDYADEAERLGIGQRLDKAKEKLLQVQSEEYLKGLVGTLGADPLQPAACMAENQLVNWSKAKLSRLKESVAEHETDPAHPHKIPSLLQRFKARFRKNRLR
jgi:hypothetical protein